jgi:hypothetical protein
MARANALQWEIGQSRIPQHLKTTLWALALVADAREGYANIRLSKTTIGRWTSSGERHAREQMSDMVRFGLLEIVEQSRGGVGRATTYRLSFMRLAEWTERDSRELLEFRRRRRPGQHSRTRIAGSGLLHSNSITNPDRPIRTTRIARSAEPGSPDPVILSTDQKSDVRSTNAVDGQEHAGATAAAFAAPPASMPRPTRAAFHVLSEVGRRLLAENGVGEVDWSELRSRLRSVAERIGIGDRLDGDLLAGIEDSLRAQRTHFLASGGRTAAAPPPIVAVRPSYEAGN